MKTERSKQNNDEDDCDSFYCSDKGVSGVQCSTCILYQILLVSDPDEICFSDTICYMQKYFSLIVLHH